MCIIKDYNSKKLIPIQYFETCLIGQKLNRKQIIQLYPSRANGAYYLDKFSNFLKDNFSLTLKEYCIKYLKVIWPKCPVKQIDVGYKISGKGLILSNFAQGGMSKECCENFKKACEKLSKNRMGKNNPMYGATPWNKGKDKRNPSIKRMAEARKGTITPEKTKKKQSESAKKRKVHGHSGKKHTNRTKEKLRKIKSMHWARGDFNRVSSIEIKTKEFLETLNTTEKPIHQYQVVYFTFDFAYPDHKIAIEVQGSYFHVDPRIYPDGPKTAVQRRNFGRDKAKKKFTSKLGWTIIEVWEPEINDESFKDYLICKLQELNLLKA